MVQIGNVGDIVEVKEKLTKLEEKGLIQGWELPYENLLTRREAAIFFLTATEDKHLEQVWEELGEIPRFTYKENEEEALSRLQWQVEFNREDKAEHDNADANG